MHVPFTRDKLASTLTILVCASLAAVAIATYALDQSDRAKIATFFADYTHTLRRPLVAETVRYAPRADWLGGIVADAVLNDVYGEINLNDVDPEQREAWLAILPRVDDELEKSRAILLGSFRSRPGWAMHLASIGRIEYTLQRRGGAPDAEKWRNALDYAAASAPGALSIPIFQAAGEMELAALGAMRLGEGQAETIRRAFADPGFLQTALPTAIALLGTDGAIEIVPDEPRPLRRAFDYLAAQGDVLRAAGVWNRWETAERKAREQELREIERVAELGDRPRLMRLIRAWTAAHSPRDFGDEGARQLVRLLAVWPADDPGTWRGDPRADAVRVLLKRDPGAGSETGRAIWRGTRPLDGAPESLRAEAMAAGGLLDDAERLALNSQTAGSFEWTGFWVAAARAWLRRGDAGRARSALANIAPSARGECDVVLAHATAAERGARSEAAARPVGPGATRLSFSRDGSLPLCLDGSNESLTVHVDAAAPTLLAWGWNGTRDATLLARPGAAIPIALDGRIGREIVTIRPLAGPRPLLSAALR